MRAPTAGAALAVAMLAFPVQAGDPATAAPGAENRETRQEAPRPRGEGARQGAEERRRGPGDAPEAAPGQYPEPRPESPAGRPGRAGEGPGPRQQEPDPPGLRDREERPGEGRGSERGQQQREERGRWWWPFGRGD